MIHQIGWRQPEIVIKFVNESCCVGSLQCKVLYGRTLEAVSSSRSRRWRLEWQAMLSASSQKPFTRPPWSTSAPPWWRQLCCISAARLLAPPPSGRNPLSNSQVAIPHTLFGLSCTHTALAEETIHLFINKPYMKMYIAFSTALVRRSGFLCAWTYQDRVLRRMSWEW